MQSLLIPCLLLHQLMKKNTKVDPYDPKPADIGDMQMEYSCK